MIKLNFKQSNSVFYCCSSALVWAGQVCLLLLTTSFSTSEITILWIFMAWWQSCAAIGCVWYRIWWVLPQIKHCILSLWWNFTNQWEQTKEKKRKMYLVFHLNLFQWRRCCPTFYFIPYCGPVPMRDVSLWQREWSGTSWAGFPLLKKSGNLSPNYPNHPLPQCLPCLQRPSA